MTPDVWSIVYVNAAVIGTVFCFVIPTVLDLWPDSENRYLWADEALRDIQLDADRKIYGSAQPRWWLHPHLPP